MYFYFYDKFTQDKKYEQSLTAIETRLIDLGINGRIEKLSIFKNAKELIDDAVKKGAHTIVAVGDDTTFANVINIVAKYDVTVGFIPIVDGSKFGELFGVLPGEEACNILSKRLCEVVDLGCVQEKFFIGALEAPRPSLLKLTCDDKYSIHTSDTTNVLQVLNMGAIIGYDEPRLSDPADGKLEVVIAPTLKPGLMSKMKMTKKSKRDSGMHESIFLCDKLSIESTGETASITIDGMTSVNTPCEVKVIPEALKIIVGRERSL